MPESIFKVGVTISLCQILRYQRRYSWSLAWNYLQYLACLKLGVNTKFVLGLPIPYKALVVLLSL